jgi:hypothetical protein
MKYGFHTFQYTNRPYTFILILKYIKAYTYLRKHPLTHKTITRFIHINK